MKIGLTDEIKSVHDKMTQDIKFVQDQLTREMKEAQDAMKEVLQERLSTVETRMNSFEDKVTLN